MMCGKPEKHQNQLNASHFKDSNDLLKSKVGKQKIVQDLQASSWGQSFQQKDAHVRKLFSFLFAMNVYLLIF